MLPNGCHLSFGSYQEESRPLRRLLKQIGGGSVTGGLRAVQLDQNVLRELASALCIDAKVAFPIAKAACNAPRQGFEAFTADSREAACEAAPHAL